MELDNFGFNRGEIVESIITTSNVDGSVNSAPMGVYALEKEIIMVKVHKKSDTFSNIEREKRFIINIVFDPLLFLMTALKGEFKGSKEIELESDHFFKTGNSGLSYIRTSSAYVEVEVIDIKNYSRKDKLGTTHWANILGQVVSIHVLNPNPLAYNRGFGAAVELAIELSRGNKDNVEKYKNSMKRTLSFKDYKKIDLFLKSLEL